MINKEDNKVSLESKVDSLKKDVLQQVKEMKTKQDKIINQMTVIKGRQNELSKQISDIKEVREKNELTAQIAEIKALL